MSPIKELRRVDDALKEYSLLPDDVNIGSNGTADKVAWLVLRLKATERSLKAFRELWDRHNQAKGFIQ